MTEAMELLKTFVQNAYQSGVTNYVDITSTAISENKFENIVKPPAAVATWKRHLVRDLVRLKYTTAFPRGGRTGLS
jgi:hypothetical protein